MKLFSVIAVFALLTGPASAQMMNLMPEVKTKSPEEKERDAITDKAYRDSLKQIPDGKAASDPWGNVRSEAPKGASKAAPAKQSRAKTTSSAN